MLAGNETVTAYTVAAITLKEGIFGLYLLFGCSEEVPITNRSHARPGLSLLIRERSP